MCRDCRRVWLDRVIETVPVALCAALPSIGAISGDSYAALVACAAVVLTLWQLWQRREAPRIDPTLGALAALFSGWCWVSLIWSVSSHRTLAGAVDITLIFSAALLLLACDWLPDRVVRRMFVWGLGGAVAGSALVLVDAATGFHLQALVVHRPPIDAVVKYHRGVDHLVLITCPILAWHCRMGRVRLASTGFVAVATAVMIAGGATGRIALVAAAITFVIARTAPLFTRRAAAWAIALAVVTLPITLHILSVHRDALAHYVKPSGVNRLEIWNYVTDRIIERPLLGWGGNAATSLPIRAEELRHYIYVNRNGVYPHNQWLELWVELGVPGVLLGAGFVLLVLSRIAAVTSDVRPFAYAAVAAAFTISGADFEVFTDSWWEAIAATGWLFVLLSRTRSATRSTCPT
jgi:exopolysaccharide production protein ExoQ